MRSDVPTEYADALSNAAAMGFVERDMVTFFVRERGSGDIVTFAFWNDYGDLELDVADGDTGVTVSRTAIGDEALLSVGDVPNVNDLTVRRLTIAMSQLHATVQDMFRGYDMRLARAELHRLILDPDTRNLVAVPPCDFIGQVSLGPLGTPAAGSEGSVEFEIVSDTAELTRVNSAKCSDETQKRRDAADDMRTYVAELAAGVDLPWGENSVSST